MYKLVKVKDIVRIPPNLLNKPIDEAALSALKEKYEGTLDSELGFVIMVLKVDEVGLGKIIPGDGATYHEVVFEALTFKPEMYEVIEGEVIEVVSFGVFVRLGPMDGLCHISQITDDFISYDPKRSSLLGKESGRVLSEGDRVRARITAISLKGGKGGRIGLTMRQPFLGKLEWIKEEVKRIEERKEGE
ncbi:MAG: DNA-directed RNA polymerase [Candidatus Baldrarchaeia archaeon]